MKYDFDIPVNRRGTWSLKWEVPETELPMWVADMDFETAPEVKEEIRKRAQHGAFGYSIVPNEWYQAIQNWWQERYHFQMNREWLIFCTGVVPAISSIVRKLTTVGEKIVLLTPVYNIFFNSIVNNGRYTIECPLVYEEKEYHVNFLALEKELSDPQTSMLIFCNPHNPIGKIWDRKTMERIGNLCEKYHVLIVSDEIHCDLTEPGKSYIPFASVSDACRENSITCIAPTKSFNLAGLQTAAVVVPNSYLRHKVWRGLNTDEVAEPNVFAVTAATAAWTQGENWLNELREYLFQNRNAAAEYLQKHLPEVSLIHAEATYLLWIDCRNVTENIENLEQHIRKKTGLYLCAGTEYGKAGEGFLRMNIACSKQTMMDGLHRLKKGIDSYNDSSRQI